MLSSSSLDDDGAGDSGQTAGNAAPLPILAVTPSPYIPNPSIRYGCWPAPLGETLQLGPPPLLIFVVDGRRHFGGAIHTDY